MFRYRVDFADGRKLEFEIDEDSDIAGEDPDDELPEWIELEQSKCEGCSIPTDSRLACPAAQAIMPIVEALDAHLSYEQVQMTVEQKDGITLHASSSMQQAARSLLGLLLPLSACPIMKKLRPMARLHLPLLARQHTAFRFLGMYLIAQYIKQKEGRKPDWELEGLLGLIKNVHMVNRHLTERIRSISSKDATVNALTVLDFFANNVEWTIADSLDELRPLFETLLEE